MLYLMSRAILTIVLLVACSKGEAKRRGPALTPMVANQLKSLADQCEVRPANGPDGAHELRLCKGRQSEMTMHLDEHRNLTHLEIGVWAPMMPEAQQLLEITLRGIISEPAVAAMTARLLNKKSDPVRVDGVTVNAFYTQADKENPRYTVDLAW